MTSQADEPPPDAAIQAELPHPPPSAKANDGHDAPALPPLVSTALIVALAALIWVWTGWDQPNFLPEKKWRLLAVFLPTILALMLRPMPGGAVVLMAVMATVIVGALDMETALAGYASPTVWMVLAAYFMARAFIKTGLARRVALTFVRLLGRTTLGLSYALLATDTLLAGLIPSNAARVGGVVLPIARSLAELYGSHPGKSAALLGTFLMTVLYQGDVVACALFITGQASNPLAARQAADMTADVPGGPLTLTYATWTWYALLPALVNLAVLPWIVYRWQKPEITETPAAAEFAQAELTKMGPLTRSDWIAVWTFAGVCFLWIVEGVFRLTPLDSTSYTALIALAGVSVLLISGVLSWHDCVAEHGAWDVFIWYGGLVQLGYELHKAKLTALFAQFVVERLTGLELLPLFALVLLIYFYAHYAFASITVHLVSMYPAFVGVLIAAGAPPLMTAASFAYLANMSAGLTHYGTTPAPIIFSLGYVSQGTWWRVGLGMSFINITIWMTVGVAWWKLLGLW